MRQFSRLALALLGCLVISFSLARCQVEPPQALVPGTEASPSPLSGAGAYPLPQVETLPMGDAGVIATPTHPPAYLPPGSTVEVALTPSPTAYPILYVTPPQISFPIFYIADIFFVDADHGWVLGSYRKGENNPGVTSMRMTEDGGQTWEEIPAPNVSLTGDNAISHLRFANTKDGWAFGTGVYATHDGGQTWVKELSQGICDLEPANQTVWAIDIACSASSQCSYTLLESPTQGGAWKPAQVQPPSFGQLIRVGDQDAWIASSGSNCGGAQPQTRIILTRDGGATWEPVPGPIPECGNDATLARSPAGQLWLLCSNGPATAMELKTLYRSPDGGGHWNLIAEPSPQNPKVGTIPSVGLTRDFVVTSEKRAFIGLVRSTLLRTDDGGYSWLYPIAFDADVLIGALRVIFPDNLHGWVATGQNLIFRTQDGGVHWETLTVH